MASTYIMQVQLADGCNPKYTLRHALGKGFKWVLLQGHVKVIWSSQRGQISQRSLKYLVSVVFPLIPFIWDVYDGWNPLRPEHGGTPNIFQEVTGVI